jgi:hypothetical protein
MEDSQDATSMQPERRFDTSTGYGININKTEVGPMAGETLQSSGS